MSVRTAAAMGWGSTEGAMVGSKKRGGCSAFQSEAVSEEVSQGRSSSRGGSGSWQSTARRYFFIVASLLFLVMVVSTITAEWHAVGGERPDSRPAVRPLVDTKMDVDDNLEAGEEGGEQPGDQQPLAAIYRGGKEWALVGTEEAVAETQPAQYTRGSGAEAHGAAGEEQSQAALVADPKTESPDDNLMPWQQQSGQLQRGVLETRRLRFWHKDPLLRTRQRPVEPERSLLLSSQQVRRYGFQVLDGGGAVASYRKHLEKWLDNKRYDPTVMQELLQMYKAEMDRHYGLTEEDSAFGRPYKTCAVVGNSGMLLESGYGTRIDAHEMVLRLNNAQNRGHEEDVGNKTTVSFINSNILVACTKDEQCRCHPYGPNVPIVTYICQIMHWLDITFCSQFHESPLLVTDYRFDDLCARIVRLYSVKGFLESGGNPLNWGQTHNSGLHYSSGFQAVVLALGICDKVTLFGFGKVLGKKHHWHSDQLEEIAEHDYAAEYSFYQDVMLGKEIPFLKDSNMTIAKLDQVM